jgi:serine protease Do
MATTRSERGGAGAFGVFVPAIWLLGASVAAAVQAAPESFAGVARAAKPAVVNIFSTRVVRPRGPGGEPNPQDPFEDFFRHFFGEGLPQRPQRQQSLGSGFVISADGYIVTNAHVVQQAEQIRVKLPNREEYDAKLVGIDSKTDVALIKVKPRDDLAVVRLGNSDALEVGDWVVAIGNPFGLEATVTAGIVSAKGRVIGAGPYDDFIQTDASINPGNSGGPLLDTQGEVIGINSAIVSRSGGNVGIGFAIPINLARHVIDELRGHGKVVRGWMGVSIQDLTPALAQSFGLDRPRGALVVEVDPDGPAARAGIERGDVIVAYNGTPIGESHQLPAMVAETPIGKSGELTVLRNGRERTLSVTVTEQPSGNVARAEKPRSSRGWGCTLTELAPGLARRFSIPPGVHGAMISEVEGGSPADEAGLEPGDVIRQVDQRPVTSVRTAQQALEKAGDKVLLLIQRGPATGYEVLSR